MTTGKHRLWKVIASEIANETDAKRIIELTDEMNAAIEEQGINEEPSPVFNVSATFGRRHHTAR